MGPAGGAVLRAVDENGQRSAARNTIADPIHCPAGRDEKGDGQINGKSQGPTRVASNKDNLDRRRTRKSHLADPDSLLPGSTVGTDREPLIPTPQLAFESCHVRRGHGHISCSGASRRASRPRNGTHERPAPHEGCAAPQRTPDLASRPFGRRRRSPDRTSR